MRIGRVGRPHGTEGAFTVGEPTSRLELLDPGCSLIVNGHHVKVAWRKGSAERPLVKLEGTDGRAAAEALRGAEINVPRDAVCLPAREFLVDDLIGCEVVDGTDPVGTVQDVLLLPAADVLEVARPQHAPLLVPLVSDAVRSVDVSARLIDVDAGFVSSDAD